MSGRKASRIRQLGADFRERERNSPALANVSACQPVARMSASRDARTEISGSTTKTIGVGICDMGDDLLHHLHVLKAREVDLRNAEKREINSAEATDRHDEVTKWLGILSSPGVLFDDESIVDQASSRQIPRSSRSSTAS